MNKTAIKNFAVWARNKLLADIRYQAGLIGITENGILNKLPQSVGMTEFYDIGTDTPYQITGNALKQRENLVRLLNNKTKESDYKTAYKYILEEVAYSWFNRLIAIRFMEVNDYLPSHIRVLSSESDGKFEPDIVSDPFNSDLPFSQQEIESITEMKNNNDLDGLFKVLFIKTCNSLNNILPGLFEETADYTELLLNLSIVDKDGVISRLIHDIPEEDFDVNRGGQVEIIGWLYQYYNTEPKNEAFAKSGKTTKDEIPAVTQLFTPDWIVRYMVENSLGRLWLDGHPNSELRANWNYYLDETEQEANVQTQFDMLRFEHAKLAPEDIRLIDPCMGSGHILVYAFDLFIQIYESIGYNKRDAAVKILENNIFGLDIDDRAYQLAYFAVLMKARQYNRRILSEKIKCHIYSIQDSNGIKIDSLHDMGVNLTKTEYSSAFSQITRLIDEFHDAKEYGSILNITPCDWDLLRRFAVARSEIETGQISFDLQGVQTAAKRLQTLINIAEVMAQKYSVTITNPPYMTPTEKQKDFVESNYPNTKADLFAVFIEKCGAMLITNGYQAMVTMQSWMFLRSFEKTRDYILDKCIINLIKIGFNSFPEMNSQVAHACSFVICNTMNNKYRGAYMDLNTGKVTDDKEKVFFNRIETKSIYYKNAERFQSIPGSSIAFWASDVFIDNFVKFPSLGSISRPRIGQNTGDNNRFLRLWFEVNNNDISYGLTHDELSSAEYKWIPYNKGGDYRRWYGNQSYVVYWKDNGQEIKDYAVYRNHGKHWSRYIQNVENMCRPGVTWSFINTDSFSTRYLPEGFICDVAGSAIFPKEEYLFGLLALCNSKLASEVLSMLNPTINMQAGDVANIPACTEFICSQDVQDLAKQNVLIEKIDWDSFETSWGFKKLPFINSTNHDMLLSDVYSKWESECSERFNMLKLNEEKLNRAAISMYGILNEMTPEVSEKIITVHTAELKRDIKNLLSYAVGCMFGRYSLDVDGIVYAGGSWDNSKYQSFIPDKDNVIPITDEEYLEDDIVARLITWLKVVYGVSTIEQNLDFISNALGNKGGSSREIIRNYFLNDFFIDHCQAYSVAGSGKRPIYWLFDSGKQNGFKALIYLHRYNADTIGNLRVDYLHRVQRIYENEITRMQDTIDNSTNNRDIAQATKRKEKLTKQLKECREYDEKIGHLALSRIVLDLDDGVKVNYKKLQTANDGLFYEVLANSKNIMVKEK